MITVEEARFIQSLLEELRGLCDPSEYYEREIDDAIELLESIKGESINFDLINYTGVTKMENMTDREVYEYAENILKFVKEDGSVSPEGIEFLVNNVPSSEDQARIVEAVKDIKANEYANQIEAEDADYEEVASQDNQGPSEEASV